MNIVFDKEYLSDLYFNGKTNDKKHQSSVRCGRQYRLEFIVNENSEDITIKVCHLLDISNHYK